MYLCLYGVILMALQLNNKLVCLQEPTQRTRTAIIYSVEGKTLNCSCVIALAVGSSETKMFSRHVISPGRVVSGFSSLMLISLSVKQVREAMVDCGMADLLQKSTWQCLIMKHKLKRCLTVLVERYHGGELNWYSHSFCISPLIIHFVWCHPKPIGVQPQVG